MSEQFDADKWLAEHTAKPDTRLVEAITAEAGECFNAGQWIKDHTTPIPVVDLSDIAAEVAGAGDGQDDEGAGISATGEADILPRGIIGEFVIEQ